MHHIRDAFDRIVPALLMAVGVTLVASGLLSFSPASVVGEQQPGVSVAASEDPGSPFDTPGATDPEPAESAVVVTAAPTPSAPPGVSPNVPSTPSGAPTPSSSPTPSGSPRPSGSPAPSGSPMPSASPTPRTAGPTPPSDSPAPRPSPSPTISPTPRPSAASGPRGVVSRVRVPSLAIDLPVLSGDFDPPGNPGNYPLCDIAQYLTSRGFMQPYQVGTTYVFAHARAGMFLPLLEASMRANGVGMLGSLVELYTTDGQLFVYEIFQVKRHATDLDLAFEYPAGEHRVILQTSEGPKGHIPKLQVAARLLSIRSVPLSEAAPQAHPRICA